MEINKITNADCIDFMKSMPDDFVDISITSPPYNMGNRVKDWLQTYKVNNDDCMNKDEYFKWISDVIKEIQRVTKYHIFFNIQEVQGNKGIIAHIFKEFESSIKEVFIWAKTNPPSHIIPTQCSNGYEYIFCISKDNPEKKMFSYCNFDNHKGDWIKNILIEGVNRTKNGHNYEFPKWLPRYFIKNFSKEGSLIFDCFMGSGTTAVASKELNRKYIGCDICQDYVDIANKRLQQNTLFDLMQPLDVKQEGGNGLPPTDKSVGIRPTIL